MHALSDLKKTPRHTTNAKIASDPVAEPKSNPWVVTWDMYTPKPDTSVMRSRTNMMTTCRAMHSVECGPFFLE